ncbi:BolA like protein [Legionella nautarum]|uniref:BolA like protein n=1 Tax=Legionella nautarum TaxID=45070 RepID=A0A0W0X3Z7_9GAMM|nr:BolA/IbaG family iron-sulfur metabolism protein [Legionella nautarum]KTD39258.1 BolA like protein [Legionella nautarum]
MISNEELERRLVETGEIEYVKVGGDGYHYQLTVVSNAFQGKSKVARQQWVYAKLKDYITSGSLHALSMQTLTKEEWEKNHG